MSSITLSPSLALLTDEIGSIRAEIKRLESLDAKLTAELKESGAGKYAGSIYKATVSATEPRITIDWKAVAMHFDPSYQLITAHTSAGDAGFRALVTKI